MNKVKVLGKLILAAALALLTFTAIQPASAQSVGATTRAEDVFSGIGTTVSTNISYYIAPARGGSKAGITFMSAWTDNANGTLKVYTVTTSTLVTNALAAGLTNILVLSTNGFAVGDVVIIRSVSGDTYQKAKVGPTISAAGFVITNDLTSATSSFALAAGDVIYRCGTPASIVIGATRTDYGNGSAPVVLSRTSEPVLVEASSFSTNATNNAVVASGRFYR
jgi:hypothetical protein